MFEKNMYKRKGSDGGISKKRTLELHPPTLPVMHLASWRRRLFASYIPAYYYYPDSRILTPTHTSIAKYFIAWFSSLTSYLSVNVMWLHFNCQSLMVFVHLLLVLFPNWNSSDKSSTKLDKNINGRKATEKLANFWIVDTCQLTRFYGKSKDSQKPWTNLSFDCWLLDKLDKKYLVFVA